MSIKWRGLFSRRFDRIWSLDFYVVLLTEGEWIVRGLGLVIWARGVVNGLPQPLPGRGVRFYNGKEIFVIASFLKDFRRQFREVVDVKFFLYRLCKIYG